MTIHWQRVLPDARVERTLLSASFSLRTGQRTSRWVRVLLQSFPGERAHGFLAGGRVGRGVGGQRKAVALQCVTSDVVRARARLVPRDIYVVGDGSRLAVDTVGAGICEHTLDQGLCFVRCRNCASRLAAVATNDEHDHAAVGAVAVRGPAEPSS